MPFNRAAGIAAALLSGLLLAAAGNAQAPATGNAAPTHVPVEGTDYQLIENPDTPTGSKVQVVEVFGYGCHFCAALQPSLSKWKKTLPADVAFDYLPGPFGGLPDAFERAFYAARAMGVQEKSHDAIFKAVFEAKAVETADDIPKLYAAYGIDPAVFASTMQSFAVSAKVSAANEQTMNKWRIDGTPTIVVDGKYRVQQSNAGGSAWMFRTVEYLIAKQRPAHAGR